MLLFIAGPLFSQYTSRDNYTGYWETDTAWIPTWANPMESMDSIDITINGYIVRNSSLEYTGSSLEQLIINDTLIINGDLVLDNKCNLIINNNGILIIRGNMIINNKSNIIADGYMVVLGNINKIGSELQGIFISNDNPVKVFIGGTIDPDMTNNPLYPVLNTVSPPTTPYSGSGVSYGNITDLLADPVVGPFYTSTCKLAYASGNSPMCKGTAINLSSSPGTSYRWTGPNGFASSLQNPIIPGASVSMEGTYSVVITSNGCADTTINVNIMTRESPVATASSNSPVCSWGTINLSSSGGISYSWSGPESFISTDQNPVILNALPAMSGTYTVKVTDEWRCSDSESVTVNVSDPPVISITSSNAPLCVEAQRNLTGSPAGGIFTVINGPGTISGNILSPTGTGIINLTYTYTGGCTIATIQSINIVGSPVAYAGPDKELNFAFETRMEAELIPPDIGEWSVVSGSGNILDKGSPVSEVTGLAVGQNVFMWTVRNAGCESTDQVVIKIKDFFVPSIITPNNDGKNDYFEIIPLAGRTEIIIFNRWGNEEYSNSEYLNNWDGRRNKGTALPDDTYFYIVKSSDGSVRKGTVIIKR